MDYSHHHEGPYSQVNDTEPQVRQRRVDVDGGDGVDHSNAGVYKELERLRSLVDVIEGERQGPGGGGRRGGNGVGIASCFPVTLDNSVMSTVFGLVFVTIIAVSVYAFHNLFRAISKRFFEEREAI